MKSSISKHCRPDQAPHYVASDLSLQCLCMILLRIPRILHDETVQWHNINIIFACFVIEMEVLTISVGIFIFIITQV